ncbi:unnamed protein product [Rotaria socialis]
MQKSLTIILQKKKKINDNTNNIGNDNTPYIHVLSNAEPSCNIQANMEENCSLSTTTIITANDNKKRTYQKWYSKSYKWLVHEPNKGGFCCICRDYWKSAVPFYSEMNTRTRGVFTTQSFTNWKNAPGNATYDSIATVTELLESTSELIDKQILSKIRESRTISIMADEGTYINHYQNVSICISYCEPTESFISLLKVKVKDKDAQTIFDTIVKELESKNIDMTKISFTGFDDASLFSGEFSGVSAKFRQMHSNSILFIHCRALVLQLCLLSACKDIIEVQESLLTLKSLFNFINRSSIGLARFNDVQTLMKHPQLKLIQPGDTRWLSYSRSINAAIRCYEPLMITTGTYS